MKCKRCGEALTGRQTSYCSERCSKLHLKSLYRQRNRVRINAYNRKFRSLAPDNYEASDAERALLLADGNGCLRCTSQANLQLAHIKPHWAGGRKGIGQMIVLCRDCHAEFDDLMRPFWRRAK